MIFFEPTKSFLSWLTAYAAGRVVYDVGCGDAHLVRLLLARNVKVMGIDPWWPESEHYDLLLPVLPLEAARCSALKQTPGLVLFCRPCHSGFAAQTETFVHPKSEVLYIGLPRNRNVDFDFRRLRPLKRRVGTDGEVCWRVSREETACLLT